jgi:hypothetical protein
MPIRKETQIILAIIGCLLVSFLFSFTYCYDNQRVIISGNEKDYLAGKDYLWTIDSISKTAQQYVIEGWVAKLGSNLDFVDRRIVLIDPAGQLYGLNTVMVKRISVTEFFKDGFNYDNSGISAACLLNKLKPNEIYTIGIIVREKDGTKYLIKTKKTIFEPIQNHMAEIISQTTPPQIDRNEKYDIYITVKNTGVDSWSENRGIRLSIFQDGQDSYRVFLPDGAEINPGDEYTFIFKDFQAPPTNNSTYLEYQMVEEGMQYFGERVGVEITVIK